MKKRAIVLLGIAILSLGAVLWLPDIPKMKPSRLANELPEMFNDWTGKPKEAGARERKVLAQDTEFERMQYFHRDEGLPSVEASIVFSGENLSQSIHRPEVCLRAQGWEFVSEAYHNWEGILPDGEILPVKEIICKQVHRYKDDEGRLNPTILENGKELMIWRSFCYTFIGHERIVSGHYERTAEDIKDRLFKGYDQRWAYATFSSFISGKYAGQGASIGSMIVLDEAETRGHIRSFLKELLPKILSAPGEGSDDSIINEDHPAHE